MSLSEGRLLGLLDRLLGLLDRLLGLLDRLLGLLDLDEDALSGAFFSGFDHAVQSTVGNSSHSLDTARVRFAVEEFLLAKVGGILLDVVQTIILAEEHIGSDFGTKAVSGTKILINPYFDHYGHLISVPGVYPF
jgi:hypothetical protein